MQLSARTRSGPFSFLDNATQRSDEVGSLFTFRSEPTNFGVPLIRLFARLKGTHTELFAFFFKGPLSEEALCLVVFALTADCSSLGAGTAALPAVGPAHTVRIAPKLSLIWTPHFVDIESSCEKHLNECRRPRYFCAL